MLMMIMEMMTMEKQRIRKRIRRLAWKQECGQAGGVLETTGRQRVRQDKARDASENGRKAARKGKKEKKRK